MLKLGIFADMPQASTGIATVCNYLAKEICKDDDLKVYYFGRFGLQELTVKPKDGFTSSPLPIPAPYLYVPCQGGVWDRELCVRIIKHYDLDVVFSEDDWFSIEGLAGACEFWNKPFHFLTPIDSLPIHPIANNVFKKCDTIYVPNSSYKILNERKFNAVYLPHAVDCNAFKPISLRKENDKFRFLWVGRDDERKALGRTILAVEKLRKLTTKPFELMIHTDWNTPNAQRTKMYIDLKQLPVSGSQMSNSPHKTLVNVYNYADVNIVSAKAGGCEMSAIESAACHLPSLVTDWNFMNEYIIHGKTGFNIPIKEVITEQQYGRMWGNIDIDELCNYMLYCLENPKIVKEMGIQARINVEQKYTWTETGKELTERIKQSGIH
jgi:glycosyltransferase involved in cell wall biosynthesis